MTKEQAERLYDLQNDGCDVLFTGSPYVAQMGSGVIERSDDGSYEYRDSAILEINVLEEDAEDFTAYRPDDTWQEAA